MTEFSTPFQQVLTAAYTEEATRYERALELAKRLPKNLQTGQAPEEQLQEISHALNEVALIEARIAEAKDAWHLSGEKPGPELKHVLTRVAELIEGLMGHVTAAENEAIAQKERLAPELDAAIRGQRMQRADGASRT